MVFRSDHPDLVGADHGGRAGRILCGSGRPGAGPAWPSTWRCGMTAHRSIPPKDAALALGLLCGAAALISPFGIHGGMLGQPAALGLWLQIGSGSGRERGWLYV